MKRKLLITSLAILFLLTGCSKADETIMENTAPVTNEFLTEISEDLKLAHPEEAFKEVNTAIEEVPTLDSYKVNSEMSLQLKTDAASIGNLQTYNLSKSGALCEFTAKTTETSQMSDIDPMSQETEINSYLKDNVMYFSTTQDGEEIKLKEATDLNEFQEYMQANYFFLQLKDTDILAAAVQDSTDEKVYRFEIDHNVLADYISQALGASQFNITADSEIELSASDINVILDKENHVKAYNLNVIADFTIEEKPASFNFTLTSNFSDINKTAVEDKSIDEFKDYTDAAEYVKSMEDAYAQLEDSLQSEGVTINE